MKFFILYVVIYVESFELVFYNVEELYIVFKNKVVNVLVIFLQLSFGEDLNVKFSDIFVIYICELFEIKGKFYKEKVLVFGFDEGLKYGKL